jgi:hypothetical protein
VVLMLSAALLAVADDARDNDDEQSRNLHGR